MPTAAGHQHRRVRGRRYTAAALLKVEWRARHDGITYLFNLSDGTTIDGGDGGNATRFLNHACKPNCEAVEGWARMGGFTFGW